MSEQEEPATRSRSRGVKRALNVLDSIEDTSVSVDSDYMCPVCLDLIKEAYMTQCGHTFCRVCITDSIESNKRCPKCTFIIYHSDSVFPNHIVNHHIKKIKSKMNALKPVGSNDNLEQKVRYMLSNDFVNLEQRQITEMITLLQNRKLQLDYRSEHARLELMNTFLTELNEQNEAQLQTITRYKNFISKDLGEVHATLARMANGEEDKIMEEVESDNLERDIESERNGAGFNIIGNPPNPSLAERKKLVKLHFSDLSDYYLNLRTVVPEEDSAESTFHQLGECMSKFTHYSHLRHLTTIDAGDRNHTASNIASSIEFDKDSEYFAVAGLTKKIKIFDYNSVVSENVDVHYPFGEMVCDSKISCVSWNAYQKTLLASSDYDGNVTVWDSFMAKKICIFNEHIKRCWSVDFNKMDTKLIASGSDDAKVKIWHLDKTRSVFSLEASANVCCVQFNPSSRHYLAFGSADHCVHYYDLRNPKEAVRVFKGHKKAVSYVKFISSDELVSASTDSQLKVWNVNSSICTQSLYGHINEKNFVGLATDGEFVACGSENNSIYVYYKKLPRKILNFRFEQRKVLLDQDFKEDENTEFVSAVCWRKGSDVIAAGNSQGLIKIFQLV